MINPMIHPMIHTERLTRHFASRKETVEAVKGVDIDVAAGELVAFLGRTAQESQRPCGC
jgi:ABC-type glutathione transport system ATPase component